MTAAHDVRPHPTRSLMVLGISALAFALAQTTLIPAIPELIARLHTDQSGVTWTITGYFVAAAVFTPVMGRLGDMFGKRRLLVISLVAFGSGSVVSALGSSLELVVAGRVLQGVGGGIFPLCFGIIRDEFPTDRVGRSIGLLSALVGIGGGLGLILGGLLVDHFSYHWIFWVGAALAAVAAVCTELFIPESPTRTPARVDLRGAALLAAGLVMPLVAISEANHWGWGSGRTLGLLAAGLIVLAVWVLVERRTPEPLADITALARPPVLMTNLATLFVGFGMFGSFILIPQIAQAPESTGYGFGFGATGAGLLMLPASLAMLVVGPFSGILGARQGNKVPLALGGALAAVGLLLMGFEHSTVLWVVVCNVILSAGIGFAYAAMPNLIVDAVPPEQTGQATGFNALVRSVGSSLGSQITAAVLAGTVIGNALPSDSGYRNAFLVSAAVTAGAVGVALFIPRVSHSHLTAAEELGAASPLGEPALSGERF